MWNRRTECYYGIIKKEPRKSVRIGKAGGAEHIATRIAGDFYKSNLKVAVLDREGEEDALIEVEVGGGYVEVEGSLECHELSL